MHDFNFLWNYGIASNLQEQRQSLVNHDHRLFPLCASHVRFRHLVHWKFHYLSDHTYINQVWSEFYFTNELVFPTAKKWLLPSVITSPRIYQGFVCPSNTKLLHPKISPLTTDAWFNKKRYTKQKIRVPRVNVCYNYACARRIKRWPNLIRLDFCYAPLNSAVFVCSGSERWCLNWYQIDHWQLLNPFNLQITQYRDMPNRKA